MRALCAALVIALSAVSCSSSGTTDQTGDQTGGPQPEIVPSDGMGAWQPIEASAGRFELEYRTRPWPVPLNEAFDVEVRIRSDEPGAEPVILVDAGMPHHQHGMNRVPIHERTADGHVLAVGLLFHMPGRWTLTFDVTEGPITERTEVVLTVR